MNFDDVLGDNIPYDQQDDMRHFCYQVLKLDSGKGVSQFPGSHPVSLGSDNLQLLRQQYYYATWKADGTRYMMLITLDGCYLIDRNFNFRRVQMRFPCRSTKEVRIFVLDEPSFYLNPKFPAEMCTSCHSGVGNKTHHYTLLDGEMIIDTVRASGKQVRRYLIYDMMAINHDSIVERPFSERWRLIEKEIIEPRNHEHHVICQRDSSKDCFYRYDMEPFMVRRKDFWPLSTVNELLRECIPTLLHEADGLIFQGWDDPYVPRTHEGLLKWKYPPMNSVDFLFEIDDERWLTFCFERGEKTLTVGKVQFHDDIDPASCAGKIIECSWDSDEKVWVYRRKRPDKSTPNDINTYRKVLRSIDDNITEEVLMIEIKDVIGLPMYVERLKKIDEEDQCTKT